MNHWNEDISKRERVSSSSMITSPDSDMQQSITSNKNTFNHLQQEPYICKTSSLPAATYSSDRHSVIYYNIHIRNNSPLHASSNETATQNRQCRQLSETTRTVFNTSIKVTLQTMLIGTHFIGVVQYIGRGATSPWKEYKIARESKMVSLANHSRSGQVGDPPGGEGGED